LPDNILMNESTSRLKQLALGARKARDWTAARQIAERLQQLAPDDADGPFLAGLAARAQNRPRDAAAAFERALAIDSNRYDAAVELANQHAHARRNGEAAALLARYEASLQGSPRYLDLAGSIYSDIGLPEKAWPLLKRAHELQPEIEIFRANLATCAVFLGKFDEAQGLYESLLAQNPSHRQNHYQLSRLRKATDREHIDRMKEIIRANDDPPARAIPLNFAIAKELEDLEAWDESFEHYRRAGDAVAELAQHDVATDIELIDTVIDACDADWLADGKPAESVSGSKRPIFIAGLPRTGTTLTERILSSHSQVATLGETLFLQMTLRQLSGVASKERMTPTIIRAAAEVDPASVADSYMASVAYRLDDEPYFIDKFPMNFLYLGFIARAWPDAVIVSMARQPMDACFSMFKQVFTWAYKFSYTLEDLGRYYVAYDRLAHHWRELLGDRLVEVSYESLVGNPEGETRRLLERVGLPFEEACLEFDRNRAPSATASSVQVRSKVYTSSVGRWKRFEKQLQPLAEHLHGAGIPIE
jgi:tetratricopeptide (TPR) repeat protein